MANTPLVQELHDEHTYSWMDSIIDAVLPQAPVCTKPRVKVMQTDTNCYIFIPHDKDMRLYAHVSYMNSVDTVDKIWAEYVREVDANRMYNARSIRLCFGQVLAAYL